jgi:hypothetical protein
MWPEATGGRSRCPRPTAPSRTSTSRKAPRRPVCPALAGARPRVPAWTAALPGRAGTRRLAPWRPRAPGPRAAAAERRTRSNSMCSTALRPAWRRAAATGRAARRQRSTCSERHRSQRATCRAAVLPRTADGSRTVCCRCRCARAVAHGTPRAAHRRSTAAGPLAICLRLRPAWRGLPAAKPTPTQRHARTRRLETASWASQAAGWAPRARPRALSRTPMAGRSRRLLVRAGKGDEARGVRNRRHATAGVPRRGKCSVYLARGIVEVS